MKDVKKHFPLESKRIVKFVMKDKDINLKRFLPVIEITIKGSDN